MDMITVRKAAENWGVSVRYVQVLCKKGKIPGAMKFGVNWTIPADAEKPRDGRYRSEDHTAENAHHLSMPVQTPQIMMSRLYCDPGSAERCIQQLSSAPGTAALFEGWLRISQGDLSKALDLVLPLLDVKADFYGTLNIGFLAMSCAVWSNDSELWRKGRGLVSSVTCSNEIERKKRDFWLNISDAGVLTNIQNLKWYSWTEFEKMPEDSLPAVWFYYSKHMHKIGIHMARGETEFPDIQGLGLLRIYPYLIEPLIAQVQRTGAILVEIPMRLLCADAYLNTDMKEAGFHHIDVAISLALPDKLYGILAEFRNILNAALDDRLERFDTDAARSVKKIHKEMSRNWNEMANRAVNVTLSKRQSEIARLVALGFTNEEIAQRLNVSFYTVKSTISMIMNKTGATSRSEFASHIF